MLQPLKYDHGELRVKPSGTLAAMLPRAVATELARCRENCGKVVRGRCARLAYVAYPFCSPSRIRPVH
jgi:hypothetical protein